MVENNTAPAETSELVARIREASPIPTHLQRYIDCFRDTFVNNGRLDARLRQLSILRIAWRAGQPFEWANHYRKARAVGVSDQDILASRLPRGDRQLDDDASFTLNAVDEIIDYDVLSPESYERAKTVFGDPDLAEEFLHLVGGYRSMAVLLNTKQPSLEAAGLPFWPPDGVGPHPVR